ncbi:hypothetical protein BJ170DRAFT_221417 [Xylariales sp. AK1849]|nr:hypothetical protein BJ170DRAFT_221417 [Xylariales sp. AK1849]
MESERYEATLQRFEQKINEGAFIAVLIDGDGAKFADSLLQTPAEGAPKAAQALKQAVRDYVTGEFCELDGDDIPILIRVYANLNDLAKSLRLSNVIERDEDMKFFAEQLTNSRSEMDFVNVGRGKENADSKIRKMLSHYHKNLQCKKIFLACCHDNGYLHDLREYSDKAELHRKIVLVETTPAEPYFKALGFPITRFDGVFRSKPLLNETKHTSTLLPFRPIQAPIAQLDTTAPRAAGVGSPEQQQHRTTPTPLSAHSQQSPAPIVSELKQPSRTPSIVNSGNGGVSISYATAGGPAVDYQNITVKSVKPKALPKTIEYNYEGCRIDTPTKHPANTPAQGTYQAKLERAAPAVFCNDHYLVGICRRSQCERVHNVDLTPQEISIHRYKARTSRCPRGPECDDYDCYLSHHCLKDPRCTRGSACRFTDTEYGNMHLNTNEKLQPAWTQGCDYPENLQ